MAKFESSKISWEIINNLVDILNKSEGILDNEFHRVYSDIRCHLLAGGTNEILKNGIYKEILKIN